MRPLMVRHGKNPYFNAFKDLYEGKKQLKILFNQTDPTPVPAPRHRSLCRAIGAQQQHNCIARTAFNNGVALEQSGKDIEAISRVFKSDFIRQTILQFRARKDISANAKIKYLYLLNAIRYHYFMDCSYDSTLQPVKHRLRTMYGLIDKLKKKTEAQLEVTDE
jgi:hypothetical protein